MKKKLLGLLCNCSARGDPKTELSASIINRAFLIDQRLQEAGIRVFLFSPRAIRAAAEIPGYTIDGSDLVACSQPIPRVNANWTYGTRRLANQGIGYNGFKRLLRDNGIHVYVPYGFAERVSNKRKAYELVKEFDQSLHPRTEDFTGSVFQLRSFLRSAGSVFIKPRSGNRGNRIFVLRPATGGFSLKYYEEGQQRIFEPATLEAAIAVVQGTVKGRSYVIQTGIESLRSGDSVFDVRAVMVNDGQQWHSIFETRLAPPGSDLSNIYQGGSICVTESVLAGCVGEKRAHEALARIMQEAHRLVTYLESFYPGELMEIGFDFVLDSKCRPHVVEINSKPGVAGFGSETTLFDWKPEDEANYSRWVGPHVRHLAAFFRDKVERLPISET